VDELQVEWDPIVAEVHAKDPWTGLDGIRHKGIRIKTFKALEDCMMFHKLTVFNCDAAEQKRAYMMGSLKKPHQMTILNHISCCKTMNGCIPLCPEPFSGIGYEWKRNHVMKKLQSCVITKKL
jgi:hypothetical protein